MAVHALSTLMSAASSPARSSMVDDRAVLTRRAALSGAVASVAMAGVAAAAVAVPTASTVAFSISPDLTALIAADASASEAYRDYGENVCDPLEAAAWAQINALPHTTTMIHDKLYSTAVRGDVVLCRAILAGAEGRPEAREAYRAHRSFMAAVKRRKRSEDRIWALAGAKDAETEQDRLSEVWATAQDAVAHYPVNTTADLSTKLAFMVENQMGEGRDWLPAMLADAQRLAKMEGR